MSNYIKVADYAREKGINPYVIKKKIKDGVFFTAELMEDYPLKRKAWFVEKFELDEHFNGYVSDLSEDYITLDEYATLYSIPIAIVKKRAQEHQFKTAVKSKSRWYVNKNETPISVNYYTVDEYAKLHNMNHRQVIYKIKKGEIDAVKFGSDKRFFIKK